MVEEINYRHNILCILHFVGCWMMNLHGKRDFIMNSLPEIFTLEPAVLYKVNAINCLGLLIFTFTEEQYASYSI